MTAIRSDAGLDATSDPSVAKPADVWANDAHTGYGHQMPDLDANAPLLRSSD